MYSVTAASRLSGVPPETLRAWERRYELVQPHRDGCGRRAYSEQDVNRLRLLKLATELGHPIRRLAALDVDALRAMVEQAAPAAQAADEMSALVQRVLSAAEQYRADECDEVLGLAATLLDVDQLVHKVLTPLLDEVGARWERGEMSVAQERMISASIGRTVGAMIATFRRRAQGPVMLLATLPGERHELGLLLGALLAAREGMHCMCLGSGIPVEDLASAARHTGARCVGLSLVLAPTDDTMPALSALRATLPDECELWLGGRGAGALRGVPLPPAAEVLGGACELRSRARSLAAL